MNWLKRWWPALVWAVVISTFSTGAFTSDNTSRILVPILHWMFPHAALATLFEIHYGMRKCGHFAEYFILSLLILRGIRAGRRETHLKWAVIAAIIVAAYASLDEIHQIFVPGRTPAVHDVMIDTSGGIAAQAVAALFALWFRVRQPQHQSEEISA